MQRRGRPSPSCPAPANAAGGRSLDNRGVTSPDADDEPATTAASLQPARRAVVARHATAVAIVAVLLAAFLAATVALPPAAALLAGVVIAAGALWAIRRASLAANARLMATDAGMVLRLGAASAEIGWDAVDAVRVVGDGRLIAVEVHADRFHRRLPPVYAVDDARHWLQAAADLAAHAGRPELRVQDGELTAPE